MGFILLYVVEDGLDEVLGAVGDVGDSCGQHVTGGREDHVLFVGDDLFLLGVDMLRAEALDVGDGVFVVAHGDCDIA